MEIGCALHLTKLIKNITLVSSAAEFSPNTLHIMDYSTFRFGFFTPVVNLLVTSRFTRAAITPSFS